MIDILPRSFDPMLLHRSKERLKEYPFEAEQQGDYFESKV